jgi:hypothetical protein
MPRVSTPTAASRPRRSRVTSNVHSRLRASGVRRVSGGIRRADARGAWLALRGQEGPLCLPARP